MSVVIGTVNYVKMRPLKARLFAALCKEIGAEHKALLFYCGSRLLSRGNVVKRVFDLRQELAFFLHEEKHPYAHEFDDERFLMVLTYLSDIFEKLNVLSTQLQGRNTHILQLPRQTRRVHPEARHVDDKTRGWFHGHVPQLQVAS
ncbi:unnamed protein product [Ixodes hexagonus]